MNKSESPKGRDFAGKSSNVLGHYFEVRKQLIHHNLASNQSNVSRSFKTIPIEATRDDLKFDQRRPNQRSLSFRPFGADVGP